MIEVWTDGSYHDPSGVGAWAWVHGGESVIVSESAAVREGRSSYAMECKAILEALVAFPGAPMAIYTDHAGLVTQLNVHPTNLRLWVMGARRSRQNTGGAHPYLVSIEERMRGRYVRLIHVKGHAGDPYNSLADRLCTKASLSLREAMKNTVQSHAEVLGAWKID